MAETKPRLVILDSHGLLYRAFYAFAAQEKPMMTSRGELTFATYGYAETLLMVIDLLKPTHICAAWDAKGTTFRHEESADYKATRRKTPDDLLPQMDRVREMLNAFNIPVYEMPGYEADDVAGTISRIASEEGIETFVVTLDTDLIQLLRPHVNLFMFRPYQRDTVTYNVASATEKYGFEPIQMIDFKALKGDTSDNISGVKGIGDKRATELLRQFGTVEGIYENIDQITAQGVKKNLIEGEADAHQGKFLVTINTELDVEFDLDACKLGDYDRDAVTDLFRELEFRRLLERLPGADGFAEAAQPDDPPPVSYAIVEDTTQLSSLVQALTAAERFSLTVVSTTGDTSHPMLLGMSFATEAAKAWYVPIGHVPRLDGETKQVPLADVVTILGPILADSNFPKMAYAAKYLKHQLAANGMALEGVDRDASIMAFLLGETSSNIEPLVNERLRVEIQPYVTVTGTGRKATPLSQASPQDVGAIACEQADMLLRLCPGLEEQLYERGQWALYEEMELPLMPVLYRMEREGVAIDTAILREIADGMIGDIAGAEAEIYGLVGHEFNIGSPQQLSEILFTELNLPKSRRTKQGYSTDQRALESLREVHPIIEQIFLYRTLTKLKSTYLDALPATVAEDGRIHTDLQQTVASTGRLSSTNPNLQNIPVRTDTGRDIRRAFIASGYEDALFVSADYSQIELRVLAHVTEDEGLIQAFLDDQDIHEATAASVYGVEPSEVTREMRDTAKMVNFGIAYGMGEFGLASRTGMSRDDAATFIETYYTQFPGIKRWQGETLEATRENGYAETIFGRRRYLPAIRSSNFQVRSAAEREAINMPIQGAAADIIKIAMIRLDAAIIERELRGRLILQVHDELIVEGPADEADEVSALLVDIMPNSAALKVPLKVDVGRGTNWAALK